MFEIVNLRQFLGKLRSLRRALRKEFPDGARRELEQVVEQALRLMAGRMAVYPAQNPDAGYRRTRTLGRLWTQASPQMAVGVSVIEGRLLNRTPYGPYVQDPDAQAWMHRGLWQTTDDVVDKARPEVEMLLQAAGLRIVERIAGSV